MGHDIDRTNEVLPRFTIEPGVISPPVVGIHLDNLAVSEYLQSREATPEFIEETHIFLSDSEPQHPLFRSPILGLYSNDGNVRLFVPSILDHRSRRKLLKNDWLLSSEDWNAMGPAERLDRVLLHELEHRLDDRSEFGPARSFLNVYFAERRLEKRFIARKVALGTAALISNIRLVQSGIVSAESLELVPLALVWANYASKFAKIRGLKKIYRTSSHEARANRASIDNDNQFFSVITEAEII